MTPPIGRLPVGVRASTSRTGVQHVAKVTELRNRNRMAEPPHRSFCGELRVQQVMPTYMYPVLQVPISRIFDRVKTQH